MDVNTENRILDGIEGLKNIVGALTSEVRTAVAVADSQMLGLAHTVEDHESRLRRLEDIEGSLLTKDEFERMEEKRKQEAIAIESARKLDQDRRDNKRLVVIGVILAGLQIAEGVVLYLIAR